jgi:tetratricopeptide (TPR) repeat protein
VCFHFIGSQATAETHCRAAFPEGLGGVVDPSQHSEVQIRALAVFARVLWLRGYPEQAARVALQAIGEAEAFGHVSYVCMTHLYTTPLFVWMGDWARAEFGVETIARNSVAHSLRPYQSHALGLRGQLALKCGDATQAVNHLERALNDLQGVRHPGILQPMLATDLAEAMLRSGRGVEAQALLDQAIEKVQLLGDWYHLPEMLRIKGDLLARAGIAFEGAAENFYHRSLELARRISAPAWELRTATSLAEFWGQLGRERQAQTILRAAFESFREGFNTHDLRAADRTLRRLTSAAPRDQPSRHTNNF